MTRYTDLLYERDDEGIYDLVIDTETNDLKTTDGLETAVFVSLFSDRRAYSDDVADPRKRRGWISDLVSDPPNDPHGSWLWLYEQRRLTPDVTNGVRLAATQALEWMADEQLITYAEGAVGSRPADRAIDLLVTLHHLDGGQSQRAYRLADATRTGILARL